MSWTGWRRASLLMLCQVAANQFLADAVVSGLAAAALGAAVLVRLYWCDVRGELGRRKAA